MSKSDKPSSVKKDFRSIAGAKLRQDIVDGPVPEVGTILDKTKQEEGPDTSAALPVSKPADSPETGIKTTEKVKSEKTKRPPGRPRKDAASANSEKEDELRPLSSQIPASLEKRFEDYLKKPGAIKPKYVAISKAIEMFLDRAEKIQEDYEKAMSKMGM